MKKLMKNRVKTMIVVFTFLFGLSLVIGLIFYFKQDKEIRYSLVSGVGDLKSLLNGGINNIFSHLILIILLYLASISVVFYFGGVMYLMYEGLSIGFTFGLLKDMYGLKGIIFNLLYQILFKGIFIFLLIMLLIKLFRISKYVLGKFIYKDKDFNSLIINELKNSLYIVLFILIYDIIILLISKYVLYILTKIL